jgi:hypothetical protein
VDARLDLRIVLAVLDLHFSRIIFTMISTSKIDEFLLKGGKSLSAGIFFGFNELMNSWPCYYSCEFLFAHTV